MVDGLGTACGRTPFGRLARNGERWSGQVRRECQERQEWKIAGVERKCSAGLPVSPPLPAPGAARSHATRSSRLKRR